MSKKHKSPILLPVQLRHRVPLAPCLRQSGRSHWFYFQKGIWILGAILGTYVTYLELSPAFTVSVSEPLNASSPLASTPFVITNSSLLSIRNIAVACDANRVYYVGNNLAEGNTITIRHTIDAIRRNEPITVTCPLQAIPLLPASRITNAEIDIRIGFNGTWPLTDIKLPFWSERKFRFCGSLDDFGHGRWFQQPVATTCFPIKQQLNTR